MMKNTQANNGSSMFWSHAKHHTLNAKRFSLMQVQATGIDPFSTLPYQHHQDEVEIHMMLDILPLVLVQ